MKQGTKKKRLRSVILVTAVGAMACGGKAQGNGDRGETGEESGPDVVTDPNDYGVPDGTLGLQVGEPSPPGVGGGTGGVAGFPGPYGTGGIPGYPDPYSGAGGFAVGTGGFPGFPDPYNGDGGSVGGTEQETGGMGGAEDTDNEVVGLMIR